MVEKVKMVQMVTIIQNRPKGIKSVKNYVKLRLCETEHNTREKNENK